MRVAVEVYTTDFSSQASTELRRMEGGGIAQIRRTYKAFCLRIRHSRMHTKCYVGGVRPAFGPMNLFSEYLLFQDTRQPTRKPNLKDLKDLNVQRKWKPSSEIADTVHNSTVMTRYSSTRARSLLPLL